MPVDGAISASVYLSAFRAHMIGIRAERMRFEPECAGCADGICAGPLPPSRFVATAMDLAMMAAAKRHGEFVAYFPAKCAVLTETQMMRIRRCAAANQAWLVGDESKVILVPDAARLGMDKFAFINGLCCEISYSC